MLSSAAARWRALNEVVLLEEERGARLKEGTLGVRPSEEDSKREGPVPTRFSSSSKGDSSETVEGLGATDEVSSPPSKAPY